MKNINTLKPHIALATAYLIYGINLVTTKDLTNSQIFSPAALFFFRVAGAALLFWAISLFTPKEKVSGKDLLLILPASLLGIFLHQYFFQVGVELTTPLDCGLITTLIPVFTLIAARFFSKEKITWHKITGILISLSGVVILLLMSGNTGTQTSTPKGLLIITLSVLAFALYLGIFQRLLQKYSVITFNKWSFLFSLAISLPFCLPDVLHADYAAGTPLIYGELVYLVVIATFLVYFFISYGQQHLSPTVVSMYSYIQPIVAAILGVLLGMDLITWQKVVAILLVFAGVYIVNMRPKTR